MDVPDIEVPRGFELVADETRAAILFALAERMRDHNDDPALGFAQLRERAGVRDSGNFNYHLDKLRGHFVEESPDGDGYVLTYPGMAVVSALVGGEYEGGGERGPEPYGHACPVCGEPLAVRYDDNVLALHCGGERMHHLSYNLPPHVVDDLGLVASVDLMVRRAYADLSLLVRGRCSTCFGSVEKTIEVLPESAASPAFDVACARCGMHYQMMVGHAAVHHPDVVSFYADHGVDVRSDPLAHLHLARADAVRTLDDGRFEVTIALDGDRLTAVVDEAGTVRSVGRG